jgi:DNA-binding XRE family transcriptional regulator
MKNELKNIRMGEHKMNVVEFVDFLEIDHGTYRGWEKGRSNPTLETALKIAKKLNKRVEDIWQI